MAAKPKADDTSDREIVLTRMFDAPRDLVFKMWTDPQHIARWWGPHMFTNVVREWDARPGGKISLDMIWPDGTPNPMGGVFREVHAPERLVFESHAFLDANDVPALEVVNTVTFAEVGGKTRVTLEARVVKAAPEMARALAGMEEGWSQSLERLAALVKSLGSEGSGEA